MPSFNKIPSHRIAALALYRAFLRHTSHLPLPPHLAGHLTAHIRFRFRENRNLQEKQFRAAATGDVGQLSGIVEAIPSLSLPRPPRPPRPPPPPPPPPPPSREEKKKEKKQQRREGRDRTASRRPFPKPPHLIVSNRLPILRRPGVKTPLATSMTIRDKVRTRQKRQDLEDLLVDWVDWAGEEDVYDRIVENITGVRMDDDNAGGSWEEGVRETLRNLRGLMRAADRKSMALTRDFNAIIAKETEERERKIIERKKAKNLRHRLRRAARAEQA